MSMPAVHARQHRHACHAAEVWLWRGMLALVLLAQLVHLGHVPPWLVLTAALLVGWRLAATMAPWPVPGRWLVALMAAGIVLGLYMQVGRWLSQEFGIGLLVAASGLKAVESVRRRDMLVLVLVTYLMLGAVFIDNEELPMVVLVLGLAAANTILLVQAHQQPTLLPWRACARIALMTLVQAFPVALLCFVLFPRLPGPLWGRLPQQHEAWSGLGEEMAPDAIRSLALSTEIALRAEIPDRMAVATLYWRGPVLWDFDGRTWRRGLPGDIAGASSSWPADGQPDRGWQQVIVLEPSGQPWLLALDVPQASDVRGSTLVDHALRSTWPIWQRQRYRVLSIPTIPQAVLPTPLRQRALRLPPGSNPRARHLAQGWRELPAGQVIAAARSWFKAGHFQYTLEPKTIPARDGVDAFLFDTRSGFCEHYASALAFLLRAAGVPARIVTGYHGGEWNPLGRYVIVRQNRAHAWVEAHVEGRWLRLDPVAWIGAVDGAGLELPGNRGTEGDPMLPWLDEARLVRRLAQGWDAVHAAWNDWVLSYGADRQRATLSWLRLEHLSRQQVALLMVVLVVLGVLALDWLGEVRWPHGDVASRRYGRFCRAMARRGCKVQPWEGPVAFAQRASMLHPDLAAGIWRVTNAYVALHYGPPLDAAARRDMLRQLGFQFPSGARSLC